MRVMVGLDDTDVVGADRGTGKLARWLEKKLPEGVRVHGIVRQQLPILAGIPYTSRNSAACLIVDRVEGSQLQELIDRAAGHIHDHFMDGSDPGLCVVPVDHSCIGSIVDFGRQASMRVVTQKEAMTAVNGFHLSGHGGTNDGIIGAAAGVGLTISGWGGRFIEYNNLRGFGRVVRVAALENHGIRVVPIDRNALVPATEDTVDTRNWLRPRLWGGHPVLPVESQGVGSWRSISGKRQKRSTEQMASTSQPAEA
jgi:tRNA(Ile2) C34 agmatinyltransferase TiaS